MGMGRPRRLDSGEKEVVEGDDDDEDEEDDDDEDDEPPIELEGEFCFLLPSLPACLLLDLTGLVLFSELMLLYCDGDSKDEDDEEDDDDDE